MMNKYIRIGNKIIGDGYPVRVIAEIGVNHDGRLHQAKRLIELAAKSGCDIAKIQTHIRDKEMIKDDTVPPHFKESRWDFTKKIELSKKDHIQLLKHARKYKIIFISSPFSIEAVELLDEIGIPAFKIASGEVTNLPLLKEIAKRQKPVILSSGMSTLKELDEAVEIIRKINKKLILMHCTSLYPCPLEQVNLNNIPMLKKRYKILIGFSDHTLGFEAAIGAVALGACIIEKHFTLDKRLYGPDHKNSLNPKEMADFVKTIKLARRMSGSNKKELLPAVKKYRDVFQKSIVTSADISKGAVLRSNMLSIKKPGTGLKPKFLIRIIGKKVKHNIKKNSLINKDDIYGE